MLRNMYSTIALGISIICLITGFFIATEHTVHIFGTHNYFFSPFADDILDNYISSYPIALGEKDFSYVFEPYVEHRVVIERIQEIIDFVFTQGVQTLQPYRLGILLWANFILFTYFVILPNKNWSRAVKLNLASAYILFLFSGININNYVSTMQITWPIILLFTLLTFISLSTYCRLLKSNERSYSIYFFILLTVLCLNITLYTFNIGAILWPIVFFLLIKRGCFKQHRWIWIGLAILNYYCYIRYDWVSANFFSYTKHTSLLSLYHRPLEIFAYSSRILSVPITQDAFNSLKFTNILIGLSSILITIFTFFHFIKKKVLSSSETIFFGYFIFTLCSLIIISIMRSTPGKDTLVEWRFMTTGLFLLFCLYMSIFSFSIKNANLRNVLHSSLIIITSIWLLIHFIANDKELSGGTYEVGFFNQVFISEATNIPIDDSFLQASKIYQTCGVLAPHVRINEINKSLHKGPYSFWASQFMNRSIDELRMKKNILKDPANIYIVYDFRAKQSPGVLLNVKLENSLSTINNNWQVLFTNGHGDVIGFAISGPYPQSLWSILTHQARNVYLWRGAINTQLLKNNSTVYAWAAEKNHDSMYQLGAINILAPHSSQEEPTWVWQKTQHFGI